MEVRDCELKEAFSCDEGDSVLEVAKKLRDEKIRHVVVIKGNKPVGMISTTDMNNKVVAENKLAESLKASEIMNSPVVTKDVAESLGKVYFDMIKSNVFSCPVIENGELKGVLNLNEVTKNLIKDGIGKNKESS
jgi:CBS domain-containing protein